MNLKWICIFLACLFFVHGCGFKDIDKRFFVVTIGIDKAESKNKKYKVILKLAAPSVEVKATESNFILLEKEANTITEAVRKIKAEVDKEIDFSHAKVIVFGAEIAKEEILRQLDWFIRRRDIQKIAYVAIGKPNAKSVLSVKPETERIPSNALFLSFANTGSQSPYTVTEYLFDFRKRLIEQGMDAFLPVLEAKKNLIKIDQMGIFDDTHTLKLYLNDEQTKITHSFVRKVNKADIKVKAEDYDLVISTDKIKTDYKVITPKGRKPLIEIRLNMSGIVEESNTIIDDYEMPKIETVTEKVLKERVMSLLVLLQKEKLDPIGFGAYYRSHHFEDPKVEIANWSRIYPEAEFKIDVRVKLKGLGGVQ